MIVYGALLSPFVRKVIVAAAEKGMPCELARSNPGGEDPAFREASPFGKIPAMRDGEFTLADSSAILHYMEARQPDPALVPADAQARGKAVWFDEFADTILGATCVKILFNRLVGPKLLKRPFDVAVAEQGEAELPAILDYLESVVPAEGWLAGPFSIGDIAVASMLKSLSYVAQATDAAQRPRTAAWFERVSARSGWQQVAGQEAIMAQKLGIG